MKPLPCWKGQGLILMDCCVFWVWVSSSCMQDLLGTSAPLPFTVSQSLLRFMSIESAMLSNHLILCHCLLLLPSIFACIRVFSSELALHIRWPKYWCFSFSISPSNEYSGLISFRMDWLNLLAVQGTLKSSPAPQFKASVLLYSALFMAQLFSSVQDY